MIQRKHDNLIAPLSGPRRILCGSRILGVIERLAELIQ